VLLQVEERVLDDILGLGDAAQHPVGDREHQGSQLVVRRRQIGHANEPVTNSLGVSS
jgi:hypothetical protein